MAARDPPPGAALASRGATLAGGERASILVVDDRPDKLLVLQYVLEELGQNVVTASSGEDALKEVLAHDFAVILLDVNMPGLDGLETAELIRRRRRSAHVPIIFITADYQDEAHTARGYALGAVDYIASPVVPEILRAKVRVFVDLFLLARQSERRALERLALAEERAARLAAERATQRLSFIAHASAALAALLDVETTVREVCRLCVPQLADLAVLSFDGMDEGGDHQAQYAYEDADGTTVARPLGEPLAANLAEAIDRVRTTGVAVRFPRERERRAAPTPAIEFPAGRSAHSLVIVPLAVRGRALAALALGVGGPRQFDADVVSVVTEVAERAAAALDNALLYHRIQEADQRKNEFIAMLAHELRNPLAPIANAVHVLKLAGANATQVAWARDVIGRQLNQLTRLVDDLLDLSRITRARIELKLETIDAGSVVAAAIETCRPILDAQKHRLRLSVPEEPVAIEGDFARLAQVLGNLVNNAAKYTDPGGDIEVSVRREGPDVVFRVRDNGAGIPRHALSSIFEPFTQLERTLDRSQGGLGIGLTLVRRLVEMQGGSVAAHSAGSGQGSEFVVRLPAVETSYADDSPTSLSMTSAASTSSAGTSPTVLVVDDNADVAESTAILLRVAGCTVHVAADGPSALAVLETVRPDAVLLDIGLPGMDGYEVAARIRQRPEFRRTLIVAVSGYGQDEYQARSRAAGVDHHLVKPIDPLAVMELLAAHGRPASPDATSVRARDESAARSAAGG